MSYVPTKDWSWLVNRNNVLVIPHWDSNLGTLPSDYSESDALNVTPAHLSTSFAILRAEQKWQCLLLDVTSNVRVHDFIDRTAELALTALVIQ